MPNLEELIKDMKGCEQTSGQSVYEHGISVCNQYDLWTKKQERWRTPDWMWRIFLDEIHPDEVVRNYLLFHDCGKPYCQIMLEGKRHFPNHACISGDVYLKLTGDMLVSKLISNDMVLHSSNAEEIDYKLENEWTKRDAFTLLIAALAEIHSNASMFGGIESTSFKIKWKNLDRRGKQIMRFYGLL